MEAMTTLSDWLWNGPALDGEPLRILLLPLPTRSSKLNLIELVWHVLVMRVKHGGSRGGEAHSVSRSAEHVLDTMVFNLVL